MALTSAPGRRPSWAGRLTTGLLSILLVASTASRAETDSAGAYLHFNLPAQPLQKALSDFGARTGHSVLVDSAMTQGLSASAVQGEFAAQEALRRLLDGTGLSARYIGRNAFTLVPDARGATVDALRLPASVETETPSAIAEDFAGALQASLTAALCAAQPDTFGRYRAALQLWVGPEGRIRRARLLESSGLKARDAELLTRLSGLAIGRPPPPELAQPLTVLLSPRSDPVGLCRGAPSGAD